MRLKLSTRILHAGMIIVVAYQLGSSLIMQVPEPGKLPGIESTLFSLHITLFGWTAILLSGGYALARYYDRQAWGRLVPWFSSVHRRAFVASAREELPQMLRGKLAAPEKRGALAGAVHGLGFLTLLGLGMTGLYVMFGVRPDGNLREDMQFVLNFHELFGVLIWTFVGAHVLMTLLHLLLGQRRVIDIFRSGRIRWK